jgi:hypothetical protein
LPIPDIRQAAEVPRHPKGGGIGYTDDTMPRFTAASAACVRSLDTELLE